MIETKTVIYFNSDFSFGSALNHCPQEAHSIRTQISIQTIVKSKFLFLTKVSPLAQSTPNRAKISPAKTSSTSSISFECIRTRRAIFVYTRETAICKNEALENATVF